MPVNATLSKFSSAGEGNIFALTLIYWKDNKPGGHTMKQNPPSNLQQKLGDKKLIEQLSQSPDAQALAHMLTQGQDPASLQKIAEKAAKGDTAQLKQIIQGITSTPGGAELLRRLSNSLGK